MAEITIGIIGATAYTGKELVKMLTSHGDVKIAFLASKSYAGQKMSTVFPDLFGICDLPLISPDDALNVSVDCLFSCLPHAVSAEICIPFLEKGTRVIDLSADFRIDDPVEYEQWYNHTHPNKNILTEAVFGLSEINREEIKNCKLLANPGCYPTSILLPLIPLLQKDISLNTIIADSKSGVSGAGRTLKLGSHYVEANENFTPYAIGHTHRHVAEIEQELSKQANQKTTITFSPHLVPMSRGILSTIYLFTDATAQQCTDIVKEKYKDDYFVRVRESNDLPSVANVRYSNFCDIAFTGGDNGQPIIAISAIDNVMKGASSQAVQNMNIMFGFDERTALP